MTGVAPILVKMAEHASVHSMGTSANVQTIGKDQIVQPMSTNVQDSPELIWVVKMEPNVKICLELICVIVVTNGLAYIVPKKPMCVKEIGNVQFFFTS